MRLEYVQPIIEKWSIELKTDFTFLASKYLLNLFETIDKSLLEKFYENYRELSNSRLNTFLSELKKPENEFKEDEIEFIEKFLKSIIEDNIK